jgi:hypothetical protein
MTNYFRKTDPIFDNFLRSAKAIDDQQMLHNVETATLEELSTEIQVDPQLLEQIKKRFSAL